MLMIGYETEANVSFNQWIKKGYEIEVNGSYNYWIIKGYDWKWMEAMEGINNGTKGYAMEVNGSYK